MLKILIVLINALQVDTYGDSNQFIVDLAAGPLEAVDSYQVYFVNGYKFHSVNYESNRSSSNSGVCLKGTNFADSSSDYYGSLTEVITVEYPRLPIKRTTLFKCDWFDTGRQGTRIHQKYNIVEVHRNRRYNQYDPFIFAVQAMQVCFFPSPTISKQLSPWLVVCKVKSRLMTNIPLSSEATTENEDEPAFQEDEITSRTIPIDDELPPGPLNYPAGFYIDLFEEADPEEDEQGNDQFEESEEDDYLEDSD